MAILLTLAGMIVGPAILTVCLFVIVGGFVAGEPLDGGGWASVGIFGGLAAILVFIGLTVRRRERAQRASIVIPILMVLGLGAGGALGYWFHSTRVEGARGFDEMNCRDVLGMGADQTACLPVARECRHSDLNLAEVDFPAGVPPKGAWPDGLRLSPGKETRARLLCIHRRLKAPPPAAP